MTPPEHWAELSLEERVALIEMARGRLWWRQTMSNFGWIGKAAQVILAIAAVWILFRDGLAAWVQGLGGTK